MVCAATDTISSNNFLTDGNLFNEMDRLQDHFKLVLLESCSTPVNWLINLTPQTSVPPNNIVLVSPSVPLQIAQVTQLANAFTATLKNHHIIGMSMERFLEELSAKYTQVVESNPVKPTLFYTIHNTMCNEKFYFLPIPSSNDFRLSTEDAVVSDQFIVTLDNADSACFDIAIPEFYLRDVVAIQFFFPEGKYECLLFEDASRGIRKSQGKWLFRFLFPNDPRYRVACVQARMLYQKKEFSPLSSIVWVLRF